MHWKDWCWSWSSDTLATWCKELIHWKRARYWERLKARRERDDRGWNGWMASLTQWTWVWANSEMMKEREAWHTAVRGVKKRHTPLSDWTTTTIVLEAIFRFINTLLWFESVLAIMFLLTCIKTHTKQWVLACKRGFIFVPVYKSLLTA